MISYSHQWATMCKKRQIKTFLLPKKRSFIAIFAKKEKRDWNIFALKLYSNNAAVFYFHTQTCHIFIGYLILTLLFSWGIVFKRNFNAESGPKSADMYPLTPSLELSSCVNGTKHKQSNVNSSVWTKSKKLSPTFTIYIQLTLRLPPCKMWQNTPYLIYFLLEIKNKIAM